jgi:hypothetical protein
MRDQDAAGLGMGFQTGRDIYAVSVDVVLRHDHVSEVNANAKLEASVPRSPGIPGPNGILEFHRKPYGPCGAPELSQESVTGVFYYPHGMSGDTGLDDRLTDGHEPSVGASLVRGHVARVRNHVGDKDDGQAGAGNVSLGPCLGLDQP